MGCLGWCAFLIGGGHTAVQKLMKKMVAFNWAVLYGRTKRNFRQIKSPINGLLLEARLVHIG
jgi:hypothetical protein